MNNMKINQQIPDNQDLSQIQNNNMSIKKDTGHHQIHQLQGVQQYHSHYSRLSIKKSRHIDLQQIIEVQQANQQEQKQKGQIDLQDQRLVDNHQHSILQSQNDIGINQQLNIKKSCIEDLGLQRQNHSDNPSRIKSLFISQLKQRSFISTRQKRALIHEFKQMINEYIKSDDDNINNDQNIGSDNLNEDQTGSRQVEQNRIMKTIKKSFVYLWNLLCMQFPYLISSALIIVLIMIIQLNTEVDQNCDIKDILTRWKDRSLDSKCSFWSYIIIKLRDMAGIMLFFIQCSIMIMNMYQLAYRKQIQLGFVVLLFLQMLIDCIFQSLSKNTVISEFACIVIASIFVFQFISKHSLCVFVQRFFQLVCYFILVILLIVLLRHQRVNNNIYQLLMIQYIILAIKKITCIYLYYRLEYNLQYDDIMFFYVLAIILEYVFIFQQVLSREHYFVKQVVTVCNFVIIQIQNITDVNIFYQVYKYFKKKGLKMLQGMVALKYFLLFCFFVVELFQMFISKSYIMVGVVMIQKLIKKFTGKDNDFAAYKQQQCAMMNGYFNQKIEKQEISQFTCQQTIIGYYIFMVYQMFLIIVSSVFPDIDSRRRLYFFIYQFSSNPKSKLNMQKIVVFNGIVTVLVIGLVMIRTQKGIKIVKQPGQYQLLVVQIILNVGYLFLIDQDTKYQ